VIYSWFHTWRKGKDLLKPTDYETVFQLILLPSEDSSVAVRKTHRGMLSICNGNNKNAWKHDIVYKHRQA